MKIKHLILLGALTGLAAAAPQPNEHAQGHIPDWVDLNGNGHMDPLEREAFVQARKDAREGLHKQWDTHPDGVIDEEERQAAIEALRAKATERITELFLSVAGDDGLLSLGEFSAITPIARLPKAMASLLFGLLDTSGGKDGGPDGFVSLDEFLSAMDGAIRPPRDHDGSRPPRHR